MKHSSREYGLRLFLAAAIIALSFAGCGGGGGGGGGDSGSGGTTGGSGTVNLSMTVENLEAAGSLMLKNALQAAGISPEAAISPSVYKIAMVNFWFLKDDGTAVNIMNPDESNPDYTEDNPLIVDFSSSTLTEELLTGATLAEGTYTGYRMQFLYIEMQFPVYFHLPAIASETDLATLFGWDISAFQPTEIENEMDCNFRLYFNAHDKFWKRDFVVNMNIEGFEDEWFWLRREIDGSHKNFFISTELNDHPAGGAGPDNTIDLFDDPAFWGDSADYADTSNPIIIQSGSTVGGLNATIEPFTISGGEYDVTVYVNVSSTLSYSDNSTAPSGYTFHAGMLDLGPAVMTPPSTFTYYGDQGLHPFLPALSLESEKISE